MKTKEVTLGQALAGELLTLRPAEYFIITGDDTIEIVRVCHRARMDVLLHFSVQDEADIAIRKFCKELSEHAAYFGQPVTVLIDNNQAFTYFKRLENITPAQLFERLSTIPKDKLETLQITVPAGTSRIFAWQGVDREYLNSIRKITQTCGIRVTEISTLAARLLIGGPWPEPDMPATYLYRLPSGELLYSVFTVGCDILVNRLTEPTVDQDDPAVFRQLKETYGLPAGADRILFDAKPNPSVQASIDTRKLGKLLQVGPRQQRPLRALSHRTDGSKMANSLRVALNSARLLTMILLSATVLLLAATGITAAWSSSLAEPIEDFQHRYSTRLTLKRQLDALREQEERLRAEQGNPQQSAAIVSTFCQRMFNGLFLTDLTIQYSEQDRVLIEAKGAARRESTVFALRKHLAELANPHTVTVNSLRPQLRGMRGATDSLFTFGMTMTLYD